MIRFMFIAGFTAGIAAVSSHPAMAETTVSKGARIALVSTASEPPPPARLAVEDLSKYLQRTLDTTVRRYPPGVKLSALTDDVILVVGSSADPGFGGLIEQTGSQVATDDLGQEGGRLLSTTLDGKPLLLLLGDTWTGACHGVYSFLEQELGIGFFIDGDRVPSLESIDLSGIDRTEIPRVPIRGLFYHPTWIHPHANCCRLWSFEEWAQFIDWMRHRRLNLLPLFHDDGGYCWGDVIFDAFPQVEKNDRTMARFVTDPTWRKELNRKIFDYARENGIQIAYNLFYSQVPEFVGEHYPDLKQHPLRMRNVGIDATEPECRELMKQYWGKILETHGIDDSHIYIICAYEHELPLSSHLDSRNSPTQDAIDVLRELDPDARVYVENWCWTYRHEPTTPIPRQQWLNESFHVEWEKFNAEMAPDIGVADWDRKQEPKRVPDPTFAGRPYIQLTHTLMEGWWPPDTVRRHPQWMIDYFGDAIQHGAEGVLSFHIQASTNPLLADLTAEIGLRDPVLEDYYHDYARRRFGPAAAGVMAESIAAFCDAVDVQLDRNQQPIRGSLDDKANLLTFPGVARSAEVQLLQSQDLGENRAKWMQQQLDTMQPNIKQAAHAALLSRSVAGLLADDPFYQTHQWQLDYIAARFTGIQALYRSHLAADRDVDESRRQYDRSLTAFESVKGLFADKPRYLMSELQNVEPEVPFTKAFLDDWEFRGAHDRDTYTYHIIRERFGLFDEFLQSIRPPQLGPSVNSPLDGRPWYDIAK